ncbi:hypothetical protein F4808DRAFT_76239 [Astrocystis sublimbata]|nr:hypothetical protein F4808DRAFT_76239 [Astrocystis sublimbata]
MTTNMTTYGRRLMPSVLDELATSDKPKLFGSLPHTNDPNDGFYDITVADIARCVDFMAAWIVDQFGVSKSCETLTYMGNNDFRGVVLFYASVKCGYKLLLPSFRNASSTTLSLMRQTGCSKLLYATEMHPLVKPLLSEETIQALEVPAFKAMLNSTPDRFPYEKSFDEVCNDPVLVLHSSGSTGEPKPITMTHASFAVLDNERNYPEVPGRKRIDWSLYKLQGEGRIFTVFPFFHLGGFLGLAFNPILNNACPVLGPPHMMPDASLINAIRKQYKLQALFLTPSIIEQLLQEPGVMELFEGLDFLVSSGAPLNPAIGDRLSTVVPLLSPFGATEIFLMPELAVEPEDWEWHEFNPFFQHEMQLYDPEEGTYELVVFANEDNKDTTAVYHNLPGTKEYHTRDLFTRHPTKPQLFKYYGRSDDIIVLANGQKLNPMPLEASLQSHELLKGALMIGNNQAQTVLLLEPKEASTELDHEQLLEKLWPSIQEANLLIGQQGHAQRGMVLFTQPDRLLVRTAKGTVIRKLSQQHYQSEVDNIYKTASMGKNTVTVDLKPKMKQVFELPDVISFVRRVLSASFPAAETMGADEDFFAYGLDSVSTLALVYNLRHNLSKTQPNAVEWIGPRTIHAHSSINELASLLHTFLNTGNAPVGDSDGEQTRAITELVTKYSPNISKIPRPTEKHASNTPSRVVLVGSTGYLGSFLVAELLKNPNITHIYCLNRSSKAQLKQQVALRRMSADFVPLYHKLHYMTITIGSPGLGIEANDYNKLVEESDVIVYNAWRLDFNHPVRSFEPFLRGMKDIIELAAASKRGAQVVFVSSVSSVGRMAQKTTVPEAPIEDPLAAINTGYAQSKLAAEQILAKASDASGLRASIIRVGQVGGSKEVHNLWLDQAWISALLRTAKTTKCMPSQVSAVDWIFVEDASSIIHKIICRTDETSTSAQVYHLYPTEPLPWSELVAVMQERHGVTEVIPLPDWVQRVKSSSVGFSEDDIEKMPALKLLDHYQALGVGTGSLAVSTDHMREISQVQIPVMDKDTIIRWLKDWGL